MDRRERFADDEETLRIALQGMRAAMWTALPGIIVSFNTDDPDNVTAVVQPAIKGVVQDKDGNYSAVNLPVLPDVPVVFPRGGGCTLTFPIAAGDECLVVFSSRCIDGWWQGGGIQLPMEPRMHDLSDGFAILGPQSKTAKIGNISKTAVQLRSDDGDAYVQLNPASHQIDVVTPGKATIQAGGDVDVTAGGNASVQAGGNITANAGGTMSATSGGAMSLTAPTITLNGVIQLNGPITQGAGTGGGTSAHLIGPLVVDGDVTANGTSVHTHTHGGVQNGGGNTSGPN